MAFPKRFRCEKGQAFSIDAAVAAVLVLTLVVVGWRGISVAAGDASFANSRVSLQAKALALADFLVKQGAVYSSDGAYGKAAYSHEIDSERFSSLDSGELARVVGARSACVELLRAGEAASCSGGACVKRAAVLHESGEACFVEVCVE